MIETSVEGDAFEKTFLYSLTAIRGAFEVINRHFARDRCPGIGWVALFRRPQGEVGACTQTLERAARVIVPECRFLLGFKHEEAGFQLGQYRCLLRCQGRGHVYIVACTPPACR